MNAKQMNGTYYRNYEQKSSSSHKDENHYTGNYQGQNGNPQANHHRHSTGKMKTTGYSFTSHQENEDKIQKKSSLKEILKNKKTRDEIQKTPSSTLSSNNYVQKYYRKSGINGTVYKENKLGRHVWFSYVF